MKNKQNSASDKKKRKKKKDRLKEKKGEMKRKRKKEDNAQTSRQIPPLPTADSRNSTLAWANSTETAGESHNRYPFYGTPGGSESNTETRTLKRDVAPSENVWSEKDRTRERERGRK